MVLSIAEIQSNTNISNIFISVIRLLKLIKILCSYTTRFYFGIFTKYSSSKKQYNLYLYDGIKIIT